MFDQHLTHTWNIFQKEMSKKEGVRRRREINGILKEINISFYRTFKKAQQQNNFFRENEHEEKGFVMMWSSRITSTTENLIDRLPVEKDIQIGQFLRFSL